MITKGKLQEEKRFSVGALWKKLTCKSWTHGFSTMFRNDNSSL